MMSSGHSKDALDGGGQGNNTNKQHRQREIPSDNAPDKKPPISITSDEVNYLIFRYMQESGFVHAAFTFSHESMLGRTGLRAADKTLPPGALLTFLQKGLQYVGVEESLRQQQENAKKTGTSKKAYANTGSVMGSSINADGSANFTLNGDFSLLSPSAIAALTRRNPPIQLTVPPAAAAAAVKARLAAEAQMSQRQPLNEDLDFNRGHERSSLSNASQEPPRVVEAPTVAVSAASVVQLGPSQMEVDREMPVESSKASGSRNAIASSTYEVNEIQNQQPLQRKDNVLTGKHVNGKEIGSICSETIQPNTSSLRPSISGSDAIDALAAVASNQSSVNKRSSSDSKRNLKKQKTARNGEPGSSMDTANNVAKPVSGFATLEEAVARLEAAKESDSSRGTLENKRLPPLDSASENDQCVASSQPLPAHAGQQLELLPNVVNGEIVEHNLNGEQSSIKSSIISVHGNNGQDQTDGGQVQKGPQNSVDDDAYAVKEEDILALNRHQSEVFMCAWNPVFTNLIATGSGDASARIWEMNGKYAKAGLNGCKLLPHGIDSGDRKNKDVTTLEWSSEGTLLATGSYDGVARVWDRNGALIHTLRGHQGPIFSLKWNKRGNYLLSGSYDKTIIVWNMEAGGTNGFIEHQFKDHEAPALDVDWKDNVTFASCSTDRTVHIYHVNRDAPIKVYTGHTDEVNAVKWDYSGKLLASCSDDCTAKVWEVDSDRPGALHDFVSHNQEIYTVKWSPTGPGSPHPHKIPLLATASFDGSIRLWNVQDGSCCRFFDQHRDSVYSVAFSPSGDYLASGSLAGQLYVWNIAQDRYVKSYKGKGDIFEVAWNKEETRIAACFSSNIVAVIDFDPTKLPKLINN